MPNYEYEVVFDGDKPVKVNNREEAEEIKASREKGGYNNVRVKRYWYMDELITQEDNNEK